jgi:hypothetical protein
MSIDLATLVQQLHLALGLLCLLGGVLLVLRGRKLPMHWVRPLGILFILGSLALILSALHRFY